MPAAPARPSLILILPIYNEEEQLEKSIRTLRTYAEDQLGDYAWHIIVGDNASTDSSPAIYQKLQKEDERIGFVRIEQKGRGRMLKKIWTEVDFDVALYMDLDLSTGLPHIKKCADAITYHGYDIAIGSRLRAGAKVTGRSLKREITSRGYVKIVQGTARSRISDYQCGFKAISKQCALALMPVVEDKTWFFDTELLLIAEKSGYRIYEEPVTWQDDPGTTVNVVTTAMDDLKGLRRVLRTKPWKRLTHPTRAS